MVVFLAVYCNYPNTAHKYITVCQKILFRKSLISFKVSGLIRILGRLMITSLIYNWGNRDSLIHLYSFIQQRFSEDLFCPGLGIQQGTSQSLRPHRAAALGDKTGRSQRNTSQIKKYYVKGDKNLKSWSEDRSVGFYMGWGASGKTSLDDIWAETWRKVPRDEFLKALRLRWVGEGWASRNSEWAWSRGLWGQRGAVHTGLIDPIRTLLLLSGMGSH